MNNLHPSIEAQIRDQFANGKTRADAQKRRDSAEIERQMAEYLASGGTIKTPDGSTGKQAAFRLPFGEQVTFARQYCIKYGSITPQILADEFKHSQAHALAMLSQWCVSGWLKADSFNGGIQRYRLTGIK